MKPDNMTSLVLPHGPHWAIEAQAAQQYWRLLQGVTVSQHMADVEARGGYNPSVSGREYAIEDGVAVISLVGPMTKAQTSLGSGCSTVAVRRQIRAAASDPEVRAIMLRVDSPGGSVSGTEDLARDFSAANRKKACMAYCEDSCCSAAYWVASQASKVWAGMTAMVGSIGTYAVLYDMSQAAANEGVKVHVMSTGPFKGAGVEGAEITDQQLAEFQRTVDQLNEHFLAAVARGRGIGLAKVRELADGRVHVARSQNGGTDALSLGLIDAVGSFDQAMAELRSAASSGAHRAAAEETTISAEDGAPAALTLAEESALALAAVKGLKSRVADLKADRAQEGRSLSPKAKGHIEDLRSELAEAVASCDELLRDDAPPTNDGAREALARAILAASLS